MARWAGEMEFEFVDGGEEEGGAFVATSKVVQFLRNHLARGEVEQAARLYEETGASVTADLLAEAKSASSTTQKNLAEMFTLARDFASAAKVFEQAKDFTQAARAYEQASDYASAARCFQKVGEDGRAAAALERAGQLDAALELYRKAGPSDALAECLARQRRYMEAARVYEHTSNTRAEVEMLRMVPIDDPNRVPAVERLAELLERFGRMDQAVQLIVDTVRQCEAARAYAPLYDRLARLLEGLGRFDQAQMVRARIQDQLGGTVMGERKALPVQGVDTGHDPLTPGPAVLPNAMREAPPPIAGIPVTTVLGSAPPVQAMNAMPAPVQVILPPAPTTSSDPFSSLIDPFESRGAGAAPAVDAYAQLKAIPIFGELAMQDMKDLYRASQEVMYASGEPIIEQGVRGNGLTVILAGEVQVQRVDDGVAKALATLGAGAYIGEMSLVDDAPTSARVVANAPVRGLYIARERFDQYLYSHETAALRIFRLFTKTLADRLRQSNVRR
ncbi:MAG: cyclic nucleotide-binding domain-containing protein [Pseudomonadota bacterium]